MPAFRSVRHQQGNNAGAAAAFEKLSFTSRKEHARATSQTKADVIRQRRVDEVMARLRKVQLAPPYPSASDRPSAQRTECYRQDFGPLDPAG